MPGKQCKGDADTAKCRESRAYCEGLAHATAGGLVGDNPHPAGDDADAWAAGFGDYNGGVGSPLPRTCCADFGYDGVP